MNKIIFVWVIFIISIFLIFGIDIIGKTIIISSMEYNIGILLGWILGVSSIVFVVSIDKLLDFYIKKQEERD